MSVLQMNSQQLYRSCDVEWAMKANCSLSVLIDNLEEENWYGRHGSTTQLRAFNLTRRVLK